MFAFGDEIMENKDIKYYKMLYLRNGNKENSLDYVEILKLYKFYLDVFIDEDEKYFYMNIDFLRYAVNGFNYYHNMIYGNETALDFDVLKFYYDYYKKLYNEGRDRQWYLEDLVAACTYLVNGKLLNEGLAESEVDIVSLLVDNIYKVNKVMTKKNR